MDCSLTAAEMGYNVEGILQSHDDNIIHPWHMVNWNKSKIWYTPPHRKICASGDAISNRVLQSNGTDFIEDVFMPFWRFPGIKYKIVALYNELKTSEKDSVLSRCRHNQKDRLGKDYRFDYGQSDHFYLPRRLFDDFAVVLTKFYEHNTWFEIAIPTALKCIESPKYHLKIRLRHLYGEMNKNNIAVEGYQQHLNYSYVHPYKIGKIMNSHLLKESLLCNQIVKQIYDNWK